MIVLDSGRDADLPEMKVVEASYRDPASMRQALTGVHTFFMILLALVFVLARRVVAAPRFRRCQVLGCSWPTVSRVYRRTASL